MKKPRGFVSSVEKPILVTGAGGFLGGWVAEAFHIAGYRNVRAGVRRWSTAVRLARHRMHIVRCDILDNEMLRAAMEGCAAVVHCAVGDERATVEGTWNVLSAARAQKVERVVHVSSVAVYGEVQGTVTEATEPNVRRLTSYGRMKLAAEEVCREFTAGLSIVVLRPTIIYGPFSTQWTVNIAARLKSGQWGTLGPAGEGTCNLVYVTDVVRAIKRSLESEDAVGGTFNISGPDVLSWNGYFRQLNRQLGYPPLGEINACRLRVKAQLMHPMRYLGKRVLTSYRQGVMRIYKSSDVTNEAFKRIESSLRRTPAPAQLKLYSRRVRYDISRARRVLGFVPQVSCGTGIALSCAWLRHHQIV